MGFFYLLRGMLLHLSWWIVTNYYWHFFQLIWGPSSSRVTLLNLMVGLEDLASSGTGKMKLTAANIQSMQHLSTYGKALSVHRGGRLAWNRSLLILHRSYANNMGLAHVCKVLFSKKSMENELLLCRGKPETDSQNKELLAFPNNRWLTLKAGGY